MYFVDLKIKHSTRLVNNVSDVESVELLVWLFDLLWSRQVEALPAKWPGYRASAIDFNGALVLTLFRDEKSENPFITCGIATRTTHGNPLWRVLSALPGVTYEPKVPKTPWCAILNHTAAFSNDLVFGFIKACAYSWVQRPIPRRKVSSKDFVKKVLIDRRAKSRRLPSE